LRNAIERAVILGKEEKIMAIDLPLHNSIEPDHAEQAPQIGDLIALENWRNTTFAKSSSAPAAWGKPRGFWAWTMAPSTASAKKWAWSEVLPMVGRVS